MTRRRSVTETHVTEKREEFIMEWPLDLQIEPKYTVQVSPKNGARIYFDGGIPNDPRPWVVIIDGPGDIDPDCRGNHYRTFETLLLVRIYLERATNYIAVKSRKRVTTTTED